MPKPKNPNKKGQKNAKKKQGQGKRQAPAPQPAATRVQKQTQPVVVPQPAKKAEPIATPQPAKQTQPVVTPQPAKPVVAEEVQGARDEILKAHGLDAAPKPDGAQGSQPSQAEITPTPLPPIVPEGSGKSTPQEPPQPQVDDQALKEAAEKKRLEGLKAELLAKYYRVRNPDGAMPAEIAEIDKKRKLVLDALPEAAGEPDLLAATEAFAKLLEAVEALAATIAARQSYQQRLGEVSGELANALKSLEAVPAQYLQTLFDAAKTKGENGKTKKDYTDAKDLLDQLQVQLASAVKFGELFDDLSLKAPIYTKNAADPAALNALITDAKNLGATGHFKDAIDKLNAFSSSADPNVKAVAAYYKALADWWACPAGQKMSWWNKQDLLPAKGKLVDQLTLAKQPALATPPNYPTATAKVLEFKDRVEAMVIYTERLRELQPLQDPGALAPTALTELQGILTAAAVLATAAAPAADYLKAKTKLDEVDTKPGLASSARYFKNLSRVEAKYKGLEARASGTTHGTHVKQLYDAALAKATGTPPKLNEAADDLAALLPILIQVEQYHDRLTEARSLVQGLDPAYKKALLEPAETQATGKHYAEAIAALKNIEQAAADLRAYLDRLKEVTLLDAAITDGTQKQQLKGIRDRATAQADTEGKFKEARETLDELQQMPALRQADQAVATYSKLVTKVSREHSRVDPDLAALPKAKQALADLLTGARALAETQKKYAEAIVKLEELEPKLTQAASYCSLRAAVIALMHSVTAKCTVAGPDYSLSWSSTEVKKTPKKAKIGAPAPTSTTTDGFTVTTAVVTDPKNITTTVTTTYKTPTKPITTHETKAAVDEKLKFNEASQEYDGLRTKLQKMSEIIAERLEAADDGHSVDAHGPKVTEAQQIRRLETGKRPDGPTCKTQQATNFDDIADWVATREMAGERVKAEVQKIVPGWDLNRTVWTPGEPFSVTIIIEHGRPIDKCILGIKEKQGLKTTGQNQGEVGGTGLYSTHKKISGLTRTRSVFQFTPAKVDESRFKDENNKLPCTGKWKLHQQFPQADDWDDEKKCYTQPIPMAKISK
jgi:hypothetical protein